MMCGCLFFFNLRAYASISGVFSSSLRAFGLFLCFNIVVMVFKILFDVVKCNGVLLELYF